MARTIENDFELTGPIERGDWETVERHLAAIQAERPELEALYRVARRRDGGVRMRVCRTITEIRAALEPRRDGHDRPRADDGGAPRRAPLAARPPLAPSARRS